MRVSQPAAGTRTASRMSIAASPAVAKPAPAPTEIDGRPSREQRRRLLGEVGGGAEGFSDGAGQARPIRRGRAAQDSIGEQPDRQQHAGVTGRAGAIVRARVRGDDRIRDLGQRIVAAPADRDARQLGPQLHHLGDLAALARCRQSNEGLRRRIDGVVEIRRAIGRGPSSPGRAGRRRQRAPPGSWRRCRRSRSPCRESRRGRAASSALVTDRQTSSRLSGCRATASR